MRCAPITILSTVIFVVSTSGAPAAEKIGDLTSDLVRLQLTLDGADYYYWLAPQQGKVILVRQCVPTEADCDHDVVIIWDEQGRRIFESAPVHDIPNMSGGHVLAAALAAPDRLVVSAIVRPEGFASVLAEYNVSSGELTRVFPTGDIQCRDVHGDTDGILWCLGVDIAKRAHGQNYELVYRFDTSGQILGRSLPVSTYPGTSDPIADITRSWNRAGFLSRDGGALLWLPAVGELMSFDHDGTIVDRVPLPTIAGLEISRLVATPDGGVYAMLIRGLVAEDSQTRTQALYRLTPDGGSWTPLEGLSAQLPMKFALSGADDGGLILLDRDSLTLLWYPIAADGADRESIDK